MRDKNEFFDCRAVCQQQDADLASVHSSAENQFLVSMIQHRPVRGGEKVNFTNEQGRNYLAFLGYLDCREDEGVGQKLHLAGWNTLGLRELGAR